MLLNIIIKYYLILFIIILVLLQVIMCWPPEKVSMNFNVDQSYYYCKN